MSPSRHHATGVGPMKRFQTKVFGNIIARYVNVERIRYYSYYKHYEGEKMKFFTSPDFGVCNFKKNFQTNVLVINLRNLVVFERIQYIFN